MAKKQNISYQNIGASLEVFKNKQVPTSEVGYEILKAFGKSEADIRRYRDENKIDLNNLRSTIMANENLMAFFNPKNFKSKFDKEFDSELLNFINTKLELYNKLTEDRGTHSSRILGSMNFMIAV